MSKSPKLLQYIEADKKEKVASDIKKGLRNYIGKLMRRCQRQGIEVPGVTYSPQERYKFNDELLVEWIKSQVDEETFNYVTKKTVDMDRLHELYLSGKIDTSKLSEDVYSITTYFTIRVDHKKV